MIRLQNLLNSAIENPEALRAGRAQRILKRWPEIVGLEMSERCWPDRWDKGTVWVACSGSAWAQELRMMKDELLIRLKELSEEPSLFHDLRFGVRPRRSSQKRETVFVVDSLSTGESQMIEGEQPDGELSIREMAAARLAKWNAEK